MPQAQAGFGLLGAWMRRRPRGGPGLPGVTVANTTRYVHTFHITLHGKHSTSHYVLYYPIQPNGDRDRRCGLRRPEEEGSPPPLHSLQSNFKKIDEASGYRGWDKPAGMLPATSCLVLGAPKENTAVTPPPPSTQRMTFVSW